MTPRDKLIERAKQLFGVWFHEGGRALPEVIADFAAAVERETAEGCIEIANERAVIECDESTERGCLNVAAMIRRKYLEG